MDAPCSSGRKKNVTVTYEKVFPFCLLSEWSFILSGGWRVTENPPKWISHDIKYYTMRPTRRIFETSYWTFGFYRWYEICWISALSWLVEKVSYLLTELSTSYEAANCAAIQEIPSNLKEPEGSSPYSQEPSTVPYPEPVRSSPHHTMSRRSLIFITDILLQLRVGKKHRVNGTTRNPRFLASPSNKEGEDTTISSEVTAGRHWIY
jgi:hypothetical protein